MVTSSFAAAWLDLRMASSKPLHPLWFDTAAPLPAHVASDEAPDPDTLHDTIVIGAGVTGLSTALHLAERGARVVVLERDGPGLGSTGRSNGQVIAGLQKGPESLLAAYGNERGERLVEFSGNAPQVLFDVVARHGIACDAERHGWIQAARSTRGAKALERIATSWARRGAPVRVLDRGEIASLLGTHVYAGGWEDRRNGTIQPLAYARGLAAAAVHAGAHLHCSVEVEDVVRDGDAWRLVTPRGTLRAATVVLATNVFTAQLHGIAHHLVGHSYLGAYSVELASAPLDATQLGEILPQRHACGDTSHLRLRYFRLDRDNRFVIGGPGWVRAPRSGDALSLRILESSARRMFPALGATPFTHRWAARDTLTPDLLPHLYEPSPGLFAALGFNGRGLAIGTALGDVLARRVLGEAAEAMPFPTTTASSAPLNLPAAVRYYSRLAMARLGRWSR
jgi:glycine/D-amino acid oxidase-like deaminating enzyme